MLRGWYLMPLSRIHNSYHVKGLVFDAAVLEPQKLLCLDIGSFCLYLGSTTVTILRGWYLMPLSRIHNSYHVNVLVFDAAP